MAPINNKFATTNTPTNAYLLIRRSSVASEVGMGDRKKKLNNEGAGEDCDGNRFESIIDRRRMD